MADEQLRLVASIKDGASAGIKNIGRQLKTVRVEPGMSQAQKWVRSFNDDVGLFKKSGMTVANVMSSMGIGGLAAGASIGMLASQFKQLADRVLDVKELGREIGVTTDQLRAMEKAGQHFGFDPSAMEGALKRLAGLMPIFRRGGNNELTQALARSPELIAKIRGEADDTAAVFKDIMGYVGKLQNPQDRIKFYEQIFGNGDLEKLNAEGVGGFDKQVENARRTLEPMTAAAQAQAQALRDAIIDFNSAVEKLELKVAPTIFTGLTKAANDFRDAFGAIEKAYEWFDKHKDHPVEAVAKSGLDALDAQAEENRKHPDGIVFDAPGAASKIIHGIIGDKALGRGDFAPAASTDDSAARIVKMQAELDSLTAKLAADKNPVSFPVREADTIARTRELRDAIATLRGDAPKVAPVLPPAGWKDMVRPAEPQDSNLGLPGVDTPLTAPAPIAPVAAIAPVAPVAAVPRPVPPFFRVAPAYDREQRARMAPRDDGQDHSLDGVVFGTLEKPILHLAGTLRTAAARAERDGIKPAAFHPVGLLGPAGATDPQDLLAAGVKEGMLAAMREWAGGAASATPSSARDGILPAAFHPGGAGGGNSATGGGSFDTSGGGATRAGGSLAANQRESYAAAIGEGLSKTAARALVANLSGEGLAADAHRVHQDGSHPSGGIAQWDPERAAAIRRQFGHLPWEMGVADQTRAAIWEYRNNPRFARTKRAMDGADPSEMIRSLVENWENPRDKGRAISQRMGHYRGFDPDALAAASGPMVGLERVGKLASEQCVALANAAVEFRGSVTQWRKGDGAEAGTLKPGTPIATFLDRRGRETDRYAGGGIGTPGAHLDHAGVFQRYITDKAGKRIGITIAEQFAGSRGVHLRNYMFGRGWGENNGSNYHAIMGPDGKPLGGSRNPLSALGDAAAELRGAASDQRRAAAVVARVPDWHDPNRPDLAAEKRKAGLEGPQSVKVDGGIEAHVHMHEGRVRGIQTKTTGAVRDARVITVRSAPQRVFTV